MTYHHAHKHWHLPLGVCVHLIGLLLSALGLGYGFLYISEHGEGMLYYRGWPGKLKYMTFWNQVKTNLILANQTFIISIRRWFFGCLCLSAKTPKLVNGSLFFMWAGPDFFHDFGFQDIPHTAPRLYRWFLLVNGPYVSTITSL